MNTDWREIPGYEGLYWVNQKGNVVNSAGHTLAVYSSRYGPKVELRRDGQRDTFLIDRVLKQVGFEE